MSNEDIDGAAWAWERIEKMAERWRETPEWHDPPFHDGRIHVTTAELHAAAILVYRRSLGLDASPPVEGRIDWSMTKLGTNSFEHLVTAAGPLPTTGMIGPPPSPPTMEPATAAYFSTQTGPTCPDCKSLMVPHNPVTLRCVNCGTTVDAPTPEPGEP